MLRCTVALSRCDWTASGMLMFLFGRCSQYRRRTEAGTMANARLASLGMLADSGREHNHEQIPDGCERER